jgi:hypothetical protein
VAEKYEWHNVDNNKKFRADIMLPVAADDVVKIQVNFQEGAVMSYEQYGCWFIPPKFVKKELPVIVEKNGSYSLDEVKTADTWIDGKPIYKKTFAVTGPSTINTGVTIDLLTGIHNVIDHKTTVVSASLVYSWTSNVYFNADNEKRYSTSAYVSSNVMRLQIFIGVADSFLNAKFHVTIYYTKTTD